MTPLTELGDYAIELADRLEEQYGDEYTMDRLIIVAEIQHGDEVDVEVLSSETMPWLAGGLLRRAVETAEGGRVEADD